MEGQSAIIFVVPGLVIIFACKSPSLCTFLFFVLLLLLFSYLIAVSGNVFLSQSVVFALCISHHMGQGCILSFGFN